MRSLGARSIVGRCLVLGLSAAGPRSAVAALQKDAPCALLATVAILAAARP